jgi:hypothetical protein
LELCQEYCDATDNQVKQLLRKFPSLIFLRSFLKLFLPIMPHGYAALAQAVHPDHGGSNEI